MKRLDINVTDSISAVLDGIKRKTERSKTELVHDAIGLLGMAQKAYDRGDSLAEIDNKGAVVARIHMAMFEQPSTDTISEEPAATDSSLVPISAKEPMGIEAIEKDLAPPEYPLNVLMIPTEAEVGDSSLDPVDALRLANSNFRAVESWAKGMWESAAAGKRSGIIPQAAPSPELVKIWEEAVKQIYAVGRQFEVVEGRLAAGEAARVVTETPVSER